MDVSSAVYPCARTTASAAGSSSVVAPFSFSANAGAVAVRVPVAGVPPEVPPPPLVVVAAGVVAVLVLGCVVVAVVCGVGGELATDTVLVASPHPLSSAVTAAARAIIMIVEVRARIERVMRLMVLRGNPWSVTP